MALQNVDVSRVRGQSGGVDREVAERGAVTTAAGGPRHGEAQHRLPLFGPGSQAESRIVILSTPFPPGGARALTASNA